MARFIRPQFSLATLLIAMAWSGVAVWMNTTPGVTRSRVGLHVSVVEVGWPWTHAWCLRYSEDPIAPQRHIIKVIGSWPIVSNAAVGVLLVVVLTWASSLVLRRVTSRLRRGRLPPSSTS